MKRKLLFFILLPVLLVVFSVLPGRTSPSVDFYFYYPDSVQANLSQLKREMDSFLKKVGVSAYFQPFAQKVDFDRMVKSSRPALLLLPEWYYRLYGEELNLIPLLTPIRQGRCDYTKLLLVPKSSPYKLSEENIGDLAGRTVAVTTMGPDTEQSLNKELFVGQHIDFTKNNIITIAKDADALMAVALGHVDAAVVGKDTLNTLSGVSSRLFAMVKQLAESKPVPMPLLCTTGGKMTAQEIERLKNIFLEQGETTPQPVIMEMLRIDGWQTVTN